MPHYDILAVSLSYSSYFFEVSIRLSALGLSIGMGYYF